MPDRVDQSSKILNTNSIKLPQDESIKESSQEGKTRRISEEQFKELGVASRNLRSFSFKADQNPPKPVFTVGVSDGASIQRVDKDSASTEAELSNVKVQQEDARQEAQNDAKSEGSWTSAGSKGKGAVGSQPKAEGPKIGAQRAKSKPPAGWGKSGEKTMMKFRHALLKGDAEGVKAMIKDNPEIVNGCQNMYLRPLELAAISKDKEVINIIMNSEKLDVTLVDDNGHTMVHRAALIGDEDNILGILSESDKVPDDVLESIKEAKGNFNLNPSEIAEKFNHTELAEKLAPAPNRLAAEAQSVAPSGGVKEKVKVFDSLAAQKGESASQKQETSAKHNEKLNQLIRSGSEAKVKDFLDKNPHRTKSLVNGLGGNPGEPLMRAAIGGNKEIVKLLLERGADPSYKLANGLKLTDSLKKMEKEEEALMIESLEQEIEAKKKSQGEQGKLSRTPSDLPLQRVRREQGTQEAGLKPPLFTPAPNTTETTQGAKGGNWLAKDSLPPPSELKAPSTTSPKTGRLPPAPPPPMPTKEELEAALEAAKKIESKKSEAAEQVSIGEEASGPDLNQAAENLEHQLGSLLSAKGLDKTNKKNLREGLENLQEALGEFQADQGGKKALKVLDTINELTKVVNKGALSRQEGLQKQQHRLSTALKEKVRPKTKGKISQKLDQIKPMREQAAASLREMNRAVLEKSEVAVPEVSGGEKPFEGRLQKAVEELRETEKTYNTELKGYLKVLNELKEKNVIDDEEFKGLAGGLEPIIESSDTILESLNSRDLSVDLVAETFTNEKQIEIGRRHATYLARYSTVISPLLQKLEPPRKGKTTYSDADIKTISQALKNTNIKKGARKELLEKIDKRQSGQESKLNTEDRNILFSALEDIDDVFEKTEAIFMEDGVTRSAVSILEQANMEANEKSTRDVIESAIKSHFDLDKDLDAYKGLGAYAILPVQRMPRYNMLLDEIGQRSNNPNVLQRAEFQKIASKFGNTETAIREELAPPAGEEEQTATLPPVPPPRDDLDDTPPPLPKRPEEEDKTGWTRAERREGPQGKDGIGSQREAEHSEAEKTETPAETPPPLPPRDKEEISEKAEEASQTPKPPETEGNTTEKSPPPGSLADRLREVKLKKAEGSKQAEQPKEETGVQGALKNAVNRANVPEGEQSDSSIGVDEKEWEEPIEDTTEAPVEAEEAPPVPERDDLDETPPPLPKRPEDEKVDPQGVPKPSDTTEKEVNLANEMAKRRGSMAIDDDEEVVEEDDNWLENL
jgi:ankyrin repeat protein